jgi:hypothetical protein
MGTIKIPRIGMLEEWNIGMLVFSKFVSFSNH